MSFKFNKFVSLKDLKVFGISSNTLKTFYKKSGLNTRLCFIAPKIKHTNNIGTKSRKVFVIGKELKVQINQYVVFKQTIKLVTN